MSDTLSNFEKVKLKVKEFPTQSGVYIMKNQAEKIIYVGKAKNLKNRVRSYFTDSKDHSAKTKVLVGYIVTIDYILTKTEVEAFLLEASLIKKHRPKYNIRLKDDKTYPYIQLSWSSDFPRLYVSRKVVRDGSLYFGPYTSGLAVRDTIRFLNRTFKIRDCTDSFFKTRKRPCMTHQIGRCTAPCVNLVTKEEYRADIEGARSFLKGQDKKLIKVQAERMQKASNEEKFEVAARIRDSITAIKSVLQRQAVINASSDKDQDAVGFHGDERGCLIETVHVRQGRVIGTRSHFFPELNPNAPEEDPRDWLVSFLNQYYEDNIIPQDVLLSVDIGKDLNLLMADVLKERTGLDNIVVRFATDEKGAKLTEMASENAKSHFERQVEKSQEKKLGLIEIQEKLGLLELPKRIECYDISHLQGTETVASQVVFEDGLPAKEHYRRYKIRTVENNDYAAMKEVLTRRFQHTEYDEPQLIVVDGGKGQLSIAVKVLEELNLTKIPVVSLAKARTLGQFQDQDVTGTEERFFIPNRQNPVIFKPSTDAFQILVGARDEAHRFAITFHRKLRKDRTLESELDLVTGLGEKRKKDLLKAFADVEAIRAADAEEIARIKGFNRVLAERILLQLNDDGDDPIEE